jgi:hypothetical protein
VPELSGNKAIEDAAIAWVIQRERALGRDARDARYTGSPADIESPPWLEVRQVEEVLRNPNFYVYVVENVRQGVPHSFTLKVLDGVRLRRLCELAKERRDYKVPWPVADYDSCPTSLD